MADAGAAYEKGLNYLAVAKKLLVVARRLDAEDREDVRRLADGLVAKGGDLLASIAGPKRRRRQPATEWGSNPDAGL